MNFYRQVFYTDSDYALPATVPLPGPIRRLHCVPIHMYLFFLLNLPSHGSPIAFKE